MDRESRPYLPHTTREPIDPSQQGTLCFQGRRGRDVRGIAPRALPGELVRDLIVVPGLPTDRGKRVSDPAREVGPRREGT